MDLSAHKIEIYAIIWMDDEECVCNMHKTLMKIQNVFVRNIKVRLWRTNICRIGCIYKRFMLKCDLIFAKIKYKGDYYGSVMGRSFYQGD